jgi:hypothetical protein
MDTLNEMLGDWSRWAMLTALVFYSYKNENIRLLGWLVGGFCIVAVLVNLFITSGLFKEEMLIVGIIVLGACFFGRKNDSTSE